mmetsp:Transcript_27977/g.82270  ORF Transcript_27977/g.82270 Transcript_27977/m.82270 type:complete len:88 (+) Transcript_27977:789-1052(+)
MTAGVVDDILQNSDIVRTNQDDSVVCGIAERVLGTTGLHLIGLDESDGAPFVLAALTKFTHLDATQCLGNGREGARPGDSLPVRIRR